MIKRHKICLDDIISASGCSNPIITWENPSCLTVPCLDGNCLEVEILEGCGTACITVIVDCQDCLGCGKQVRTFCFCDESADCGDCEDCIDGLCVDQCTAGQTCVNNNCQECAVDGDCKGNKKCIDGGCQCDPSTPHEGLDGNCYACINSAQCGPCSECVGNVCQPKNCGTGHCNPEDDNCYQCVTNEHCTNPNECCVGGTCQCCPGFEKDPSTGDCVEIPECRENTDCGSCKDCVQGACVDRNCGDCKTCLNDDCVQSCKPGCGNCPTGYGCINDICVLCSNLNCNGSGLDCNQAAGCQCDENNDCVAVDCNLNSVSLSWKKEQGTPGNTTIPGVPAPTPTASMSALGVTSYNGAQYQDFQFNFGVSSGETGSWTLNAGDGIVSLPSGSSVSFKLSDYTPPNVFGFVVQFQGTGQSAGASVSFDAYPDFGSDFIDSTLWTIDSFPSGTGGSTTGGTPSVWTLCSSNGDFAIQSIMKDEANSSGTIEITLGGTHASGCRIATISGCGTWAGTAKVLCGGTEYDVPVDTFSIPEDACCDPTEDDCPTGTGDPCTTPTIENITLGASSTGEGNNEYGVKADWQNAGFSRFSEWLVITKCWSVDGVVSLVTGASAPFGGTGGVSVSAPGIGCVYLGHSCSMNRPGCKKLQGEHCFEDCDPQIPCSGDFSVAIIGNDPYTAYASNSVGTTYIWTLNGTTISTGITAVPTVSGTLIVEARNGDCVCTDQVILVVENRGCINPAACNYDENADVDDGSCVVVGDFGYECDQGFQVPPINTGEQAVTFRYNGSTIGQGSSLPSNTNVDIEILIGGVVCDTREFFVRRCWNCVSGSCDEQVETTTGFNESTCGGANCASSLIVATGHSCSDDSRVTLSAIATGGSGSYTALFEKTGGALLEGGVAATAGVAVQYTSCVDNVTVKFVDNSDPNLTGEQSWSTNELKPCCSCAENLSTITKTAIDEQAGSVNFNYTTDRCSPNYVVRLYDTRFPESIAEKTITPADTTDTNPISDFINLGGSSFTTGTYYLRIYPQGFCGTEDPSGDLCFSQDTNFDVVVVGSGDCLFDDILSMMITTSAVEGVPTSVSTSYQIEAPLTYVGKVANLAFYRSDVTTAAAASSACSSILDPAGVVALPNTMNSITGPFVLNGTGDRAVLAGSFETVVTVGVNQSICTGMTAELASDPGVCVGFDTGVYLNDGTVPSITITDTSLTVTGTGTNLNNTTWISENIPGGQLYIIIQQSDNPAADPCVDAIIFNGPIPLNGSLSTIVEPLQSTDTVLTITITDNLAIDTCTPTGTYDQDTTDVPACTCAAMIDEVSYSPTQQEVYVRGNASCFTDLANLQFEFDLMTDSSCSVVDTADIIPAIVGFTQSQADGSSGFFRAFDDTPTAQYIRVTISDNGTGGCDATACLEIPACGTACGVQTAVTVADRFQNLQDTLGNFYILPGVYELDCNSPSTPNDTFGAALELELQAQDTCATTGVTVALSQVAGSGEDTDCLTNEVIYTDGGSGTLNLVYEGITIDATPYAASIIYGSYAAGVPSLTSGAMQSIADHVRASLDAEGAIYSSVTVNLQDDGANDIQLYISVDHIITTTATFQTNNTDTPSVVNTALAANCNAPTDLGGGGSPTTSSFSPSTLGCLQIQITGSTIEFTSITVGTDTSTFSGC